MILQDTETDEQLTLSDELLWTDEYAWVPPQATKVYSLSGALLIQTGTRKAGRPISLEYTNESMGWMPRSTVITLTEWASLPDRVFKLTFTRGLSRFFYVRFDHDKVIDAKPVLGHVGKNLPGDQMLIKVNFYEVGAP